MFNTSRILRAIRQHDANQHSSDSTQSRSATVSQLDNYSDGTELTGFGRKESSMLEVALRMPLLLAGANAQTVHQNQMAKIMKSTPTNVGPDPTHPTPSDTQSKPIKMLQVNLSSLQLQPSSGTLSGRHTAASISCSPPSDGADTPKRKVGLMPSQSYVSQESLSTGAGNRRRLSTKQPEQWELDELLHNRGQQPVGAQAFQGDAKFQFADAPGSSDTEPNHGYNNNHDSNQLSPNSESARALCATAGDTTQEFSTGEQFTGGAGGAGLDSTHHDARDIMSEDDEISLDQRRGLVKYAKLILPHVGLVLLTCTYTLLGAAFFLWIEGPHERETKQQQLTDIWDTREAFLDHLWHLARNNSVPISKWKSEATGHLLDMSDDLFDYYTKHFLTAREIRINETIEVWNFQTAIFFTISVVTTIGYGFPVPVTDGGRLACVAFALFGIPLTLVTIADIGKFFSEHLIWSYKQWLTCRRRASGWARRCTDRWRAKRAKRKHGHCIGNHTTANPVHGGPCTQHDCEHCREQELEEPDDLLDIEVTPPATIVLAILLGYTALGGWLMSTLEPWTFLASFYYSFITMTTVGFGDLIPKRDGYLAVILLYIVVGLAITTMCIDLVGVQYIHKIHYFGRKLQYAKTAFAIVGGKVVLVSELYGRLQRRRADGRLELVLDHHIDPFVPRDIRRIRYIDRDYGGLFPMGYNSLYYPYPGDRESISTSTSSVVDFVHASTKPKPHVHGAGAGSSGRFRDKDLAAMHSAAQAAAAMVSARINSAPSHILQIARQNCG